MNFFLLVIAGGVVCIGLSASADVVGRTRCEPGDPKSPYRRNTTKTLTEVRESMSEMEIDGKRLAGYIQYTTDTHMNEYHLLVDHDQRVKYLSNFKGKGFAFVTKTKAAVFTARSFRQQADDTMDCNWSLLFWSHGDNGSSTIGQWFASAVGSDDKYIGIDASLITKAYFDWFEKILSNLKNSLILIATDSSNKDLYNPIDKTWENMKKWNIRPEMQFNPINILSLSLTGVSWQEKIKNLQDNITAKGADVIVITALDEIAWLFNLRGSDQAFGPYFYAYALVERDRISLYIGDRSERLQYVDSESNLTLYEYLGTDETGFYPGPGTPRIHVLEYSPGQDGLKDLLNVLSNEFHKTFKVWITPDTNYEIFLFVQKNYILAPSPIAIDKSVKNKNERQGMRHANLRDSVALIRFLAFLEKEIKSGNEWTEYLAAERLQNERRRMSNYRGQSFETIAAYGSNGAIPHHRASGSKVISNDSFFVLNSGGDYLDGMTDVTRTMHYGQPTEFQKECYTRVLMAKINLAMFKWPEGLTGSQMDAINLHQLWDVGLNYHHRKDHEIKAYLNVKEGPEIGETKAEESLKAYQYYTIEPAYYEEGHFGIKLESTFRVTPFVPKFNTATKNFLQFEINTFVPFEPNLIQYNLLNQRQIDWLNNYNAQIKKYLLRGFTNDSVTLDWLNARTKPLNISNSFNLSISGNLSMNMKVEL